MIEGLSIVICTYNRIELLKKAIASIQQQTIAKWELVVVDNNSSDGTEGYVKKVIEDDTRISYFKELRQGVAFARNTGAAHAKYPIIAYLDDDEEADSKWGEAIYNTFLMNENVGIVGGPMILQDRESIPSWVSSKMYSILGDFQLPFNDGESYDIGNGSFPTGNLAVRKDVFQMIDGFCTNKGRKGKILLADEDTILCKDVFATGYRLYYNPCAHVRHALIKERIKPEYFFRNARGLAKTRAKKGKQFSYIAELLYRMLKLPIDVLFRTKHWFFSIWRIYTAWYKFIYSFQK
ncbi:glycosyltransferase family 2 protein [Anaeroarcus burkinensis]|uniref:glycosyltransferase family 2 protein n=1 Tax=Anaeroarcus burkinensis TaxID=82376 RepID=UPI00041209E0|nr:glycosyltransferase family 2 protein [Anaeroarcus burkinensis]